MPTNTRRKPATVTTRRVPDPRQERWSTSHVGTVQVFAVGVTVNCDCGQPFHADTREAAESKWAKHVKRARV